MSTIKMWLRNPILVFILGSIFILGSCGKGEPSTKAPGSETPTTLRDAMQSGFQLDVPLRDVYKDLLTGIWNHSGVRVLNGSEKEYSWGKAQSDHTCVIIDLNCDTPFFLSEGEKLYIGDIDFSDISNNEIVFNLKKKDGEVRGLLRVKFYGKRAIRFEDINKSFIWGMDYNMTYYKIGGPGADDV